MMRRDACIIVEHNFKQHCKICFTPNFSSKFVKLKTFFVHLLKLLLMQSSLIMLTIRLISFIVIITRLIMKVSVLNENKQCRSEWSSFTILHIIIGTMRTLSACYSDSTKRLPAGKTHRRTDTETEGRWSIHSAKITNKSEESDEAVTATSEGSFRSPNMQQSTPSCLWRNCALWAHWVGWNKLACQNWSGQKAAGRALHAVEATHTNHHGRESRRMFRKGFINPAICRSR